MADKVNVIKQKLIEAKGGLNALLEQQSAVQAEISDLLARQLEGKATEDDKPKLQAAESKAKDLAGKLSTARALVLSREQELQAEEERLKQETATATPVEVRAPNSDQDRRRGFRSHREFLLACLANAGLRDRAQVQDERLRALAVADKEDKAAAGELAFMLPLAYTPAFLSAAGSDEQGEYDDRYGGITLPHTRLPGFLQVGFEGDPTAGRTQPVPMQSPSVGILARTDKNHQSSVAGGFTVSRRPETAAAAASRAQMEEITLKATSVFGVAYSTEELLTDSPLSFVAIIDSGMRDQMGAHMLNEKLRGKGGNEYLGVLDDNNPCLITVAKETGQTNDTIVANNVIKMAARCWGFGGGVWLANHDTRPQLYTLQIPAGTSAVLIYQPSREVGFPDMLMGIPVFYTEFASKLGDKGDLLLGVWSQYLDGLYQSLQSAESVHVRFLNHERTFKFWVRNAGAPWWRSALTPNQSADTLSPFVTLAAR